MHAFSFHPSQQHVMFKAGFKKYSDIGVGGIKSCNSGMLTAQSLLAEFLAANSN